MAAMIEFSHVFYTYPNGVLANEDINLRIEQGERVAIIGQNGAGKTTAVKLMNGLYKPSKGTVYIEEKDTRQFTTAQIARKIGYVFQNPDDQIFNNTVISEVEYMPRYFKMPQDDIVTKVEWAFKLLGIEQYRLKNPFEVPYAIRKFVAIAAVLVTDPTVVILDEPTAGQDSRGIAILENLLTKLQAKGIGVVVISHDMEFVARNFSRVIAMANKKIIMDGSAEQIFGAEEVLTQSCVERPQVCEVAHRLQIPEVILSRSALINYYKNR